VSAARRAISGSSASPDSDSTTIWTPDISNTADFATLDDALSGINALALLQANALGIFTRVGTYAPLPTGNQPPFTRALRVAHGSSTAATATSTS
jgi:hypothetical protein